MAKLELISPWIDYCRKVQALFAEDSGVKVIMSEDDYILKLLIEERDKAEMLTHMLPQSKTFGNIELKIDIIPGDLGAKHSFEDKDFKVAFKGNKAMVSAKTYRGFASNPVTFVIFKKEIVQYYSDNIASPTGVKSTLYEDIARDVFIDMGNSVFFSTSPTYDDVATATLSGNGVWVYQ